MTHRLLVEIRLRSPLCIAQRPTAPGQPIKTLPYISGTVLRGGIATAWLQGRRYEELSCTERETFRSLFLQSALRFEQCWPVVVGATTCVVPTTAWTQKHQSGGFLNDPGYPAGVTDQLVAFLQNKGPGPYDSLEPCGTLFAAYDDTMYQSIDIQKRLITRTAIDSQRGTARSGYLYTLEALETGQSFRGVIRGTQGLLNEVCRTLQQHPVLTMGQGRSRGLGTVKVEVLEEPVAELSLTNERNTYIDAIEQFTQRAQHTNDQLRKDHLLLPITLEADMLLRDAYLLPSSDPHPTTTLGRYLPLPDTLQKNMHMLSKGVVQSIHWIGGWDEIRQVPRTPRLAIAMGSVWTFAVPRTLLDQALDWWLQAQLTGLGERRNEGFGRIRLCHPFHRVEGPL